MLCAHAGSIPSGQRGALRVLPIASSGNRELGMLGGSLFPSAPAKRAGSLLPTGDGFGRYPADAPLPTVPQMLDGEKAAKSAAVCVDMASGSQRHSGGDNTVMQQLLTDVRGQPSPALLADVALRPVGRPTARTRNPCRAIGGLRRPAVVARTACWCRAATNCGRDAC